MYQFVTYGYDLVSAVREKIGVNYLRNPLMRALTSSSIPMSVTSNDGVFSGVLSRSMSSRYKNTVYRILSQKPGDQDARSVINAGKDMSMVSSPDMGIAVSMSIVAASLKRYNDITVTLDELDSKLAATAPVEGSTGSETARVDSLNVQKSLDALWTSSGVIAFLSDLKSVSTDVVDPENAVNIVSVINSWFPKESAASFIEKHFDCFSIGLQPSFSNVKVTDGDPASKMNFFEAAKMKPDIRSSGISYQAMVAAINSPSSPDSKGLPYAKQWDSLNTIFSPLTLMETLYMGDQFPHIYDLMIKVTAKPSEFSDSKTLNQLLTEIKRVQIMYQIQVFLHLQVWVAMMQIYISHLSNPAMLDLVDTALPTLGVDYNMREILKKFSDIRVGKVTSALLSDINLPSQLSYKGVSIPGIWDGAALASQNNTVIDIVGLFKGLIPSLHTLMSNKMLWEIYNAGADICNAVSLRQKSISIDLDHLPVTLCQFGIMSGSPITSKMSFDTNALFDWGINWRNASARTAVQWRDYSKSPDIAPIAYATINYGKEVTIRDSFINEARGSNGVIDPIAWSGENVPIMPLRRVTSKGYMRSLFFDRSILTVGPACLLPVAPSYPIAVTNSSLESALVVKKTIIGKYEIAMDALAMQFTHYGRLEAGKIKLAASTLAERLGIHPEAFLSALNFNDPVLGRFVNKGEEVSLVCSSIIEDPLFKSMVENIWYVPTSHLSGDFNMTYVTNDLAMTNNPEVTMSTHIRPLRYGCIMKDTDDARFQGSSVRASGVMTHVDDVMVLHKTADDVNFAF